jgi:phage gp36-like protein
VAYASQEDVERVAGGAQALADLTDLDGTGSGEVDPDVLAAALADADAEINSYVGRNRKVPLAEPYPPRVKRVAAEEAVHLLRLRRRMVGDADQQQHEDNLRWLEGVAKGFLTLGVEPQGEKSSLVSPAVVLVGEDDREITAENLKGIW